MFYSEVIIYL